MLEQTQREILSLQQQIKIQEKERDSNLATLTFMLIIILIGGVIIAYQNAINQNMDNIAALKNRIKQIQSRTNPRAKAVLEKMQVKSSAKNDMPNQSLDTISPEKTQKGKKNAKIFFKRKNYKRLKQGGIR